MTLGTFPQQLWAAHKATLRGKLIKMTLRLQKAHKSDIEKLKKDFVFLNKQHKKDPTSVLAEKLDTAHTALNLALIAIAEKSLQ